MDTSTVIWIIVAIVVVLAVIAIAVALARRTSAKKEVRNRERADELRAQAAATHEGIKRHQAEADAADARAREMRAEADRKIAEAKRMEADVRDKKSTLHEHVQRRDEVLRQADEIDPDVEDESGAEVDSSSGQHRA